MRIQGNTYTAEVTSQNRLKTDNKTPLEIAVDNQDAFAVPYAQDSGAVTSDFFYLKNTSARNLKIYKISSYTTTLDVEVSITTGVTGSPTTGTAITPINLYAGGKAADVTCEGRDGDMALTGGSVVDVLFVDKDFVGIQEWDYPAPILLPPNTAMVMNVNIDPTADVEGTLFFYFEDVE